MDYLSLKAAVREAGKRFTGIKVRHAGQISPTEAVLDFPDGAALILSINPRRPGLFILDRADPLPSSSTPFSDLLGAKITGATLVSLRLPEPGERLVFFDFTAGWPAEKGLRHRMVLEVMGRHSNLAVLNGDTILQPLKPVSARQSRLRPVLPGERWVPPPPRTGIAVEEVASEHLPELSSCVSATQLMRAVRGLSPYTADQAVRKAAGGGTGALYRVLASMADSADGENGYLHRSGTRSQLVPFEPVTTDSEDSIEHHTPFSVASAIWREEAQHAGSREEERKRQLVSGLRNVQRQLTASLGQLDTELERCMDYGSVRLMAETLLVHASRIKQGPDSVILPDPYNPGNDLTIPLDPSLSPAGNAGRMFSEAHRMERGTREIPERRKQIERRLDEVKRALAEIRENGNPVPAGIHLQGTPVNQAERGAGSFRAYAGPGKKYTVGGFTVLVGRSARDNEKVTFQAAEPHDLWLHARDYPGSHVVILSGRKRVPDGVLYRAAELAAESSGARNDKAPEVMVTERKWVRKVKGGKPGKVTVERFRTIRPRMGQSRV